MTWTYTPEYYKQYTRDTWNESAPSYGPVLQNLDRFNRDLLAAANPRRGEVVLDVATGPGEPALTIAGMVRPGGRVVGIDLSERMIEIANATAKARELTNVEFKVMDAESLEFANGTFDAAVCRFGLQIVTDPDAAMKEVVRVLKDGGRFASTVWGLGERTPAIHAIVGPMLKHAEPDETGYLPTPYEMGGPGELREIFEKHGLHDVHESRVVRAWEFADERAYFDATLKGTPIGHSLLEEPEDVQRQVLEETKANLQRWKRKDGSLEMPAECVTVVGRK